MEINNQVESDIIAGVMGAILGGVLKPWNLTLLGAALAGFGMAAVFSAVTGRLSGETFHHDTAALMGVFMTGFVMTAAL